MRAGVAATDFYAEAGASVLTMTRKADREAMYQRVKAIAEAAGGASWWDENLGNASVHVAIQDVEVFFWISKKRRSADTFVLHWTIGRETGEARKFSPHVHNPWEINRFHGQKATDVCHGVEWLCELLAQRLASINNGMAFEDALEVTP